MPPHNVTRPAPRFTSFSLERYRAFGARVQVELAPITVVIGKNNLGKSTLIRAPWFVSQPFADRNEGPFAAKGLTGDPAPSLLRVAYNGSLQGFEATLCFEHGEERWSLSYQASAQVGRNESPILAGATFAKDGETLFVGRDIAWSELAARAREYGHAGIHEQVQVIGGLRKEHAGPWSLGVISPTGVGFQGENAPYILAEAGDSTELQRWSTEHLGVEFRIDRDRHFSRFHVLARSGGFDALLSEVGAGVVQVFPIAVALLQQPKLPALLCVEQPELHLHPHAHRGAAELFIRARERHPDTRFLIETHSDTFILRLRRAVVEGRLRPEDVLLWTVESGPDGSEARPIRLNHRGVPDWWPKGVFAEAQEEFTAMRRALAERTPE